MSFYIERLDLIVGHFPTQVTNITLVISWSSTIEFIKISIFELA